MQLFVIFFCVFVCVESVFLDFLSVRNNEYKCGTEASPNLLHQNPWLVYLEYYARSHFRENVRCAGTLIDDRHVVTAAHCVKNTLYSRIVARLGEYDVTSDVDCVDGVCTDPVVRISVANIIVHEGYDDIKDDIAVLVLAEPAPYTDFIRPICLPSQSIKTQVTFTAAGWGELTHTHSYSHVKKIIPLPGWSKKDCKEAYQRQSFPVKIICAGGEEGIDTCRGDSGGPLILNRGVTELWGVTSAGNKHCGTKGTPGIYTNVAEHLDWLIGVVRAY